MFLTIFLSWGQQLFLPPGHFVNLYMMIRGTEEHMLYVRTWTTFQWFLIIYYFGDQGA